jgi:hypothetical protein
MEVALYCNDPYCTVTRRPNGDKAYKSKVLKTKVLWRDFRPGKHVCPDCNSLLIQGIRRDAVLKNIRKQPTKD